MSNVGGTLSSASVYKRGNSYKSAIDTLWLEYKVAAQYVKLWDRVEENVALIRRKEMRGSLPTQDDLAGLVPVSSHGASPAYWMQQVWVPRWFIMDELGIGTDTNVFDTTRGLKESNAKRRRRYADQLERLEKARQVLSRTVKG